MKLSVLLCCSLLLRSATGVLVNWESHGEIVDLERLNKPAIDENLIRELQSSNDLAAATWTSGLNERFEGMKLADAKVLLESCKTSPESPRSRQGHTPRKKSRMFRKNLTGGQTLGARTVLPYEKYATKRTVEAVGRLEVSKQ